MKTFSNLLKVLLGAAIIAAVLIALWSLPGAGAGTKQAAVMVASSPTEMKDVHVRLWADQSVVAPSGTVQLRLRFENGTKDTLKAVRILDIQEPGFQYVPLALNRDSMKKGEAAEAEVKLRPSTDHGSYRVAIRYQLTDAADMVHEGTIASSPIAVRDEKVERRQLFFRRLTSLGKDLTLPIGLALLGLWFQRRQGVESQRQQIWTTILPHFYELSEKHYLPIVRSLRMINRYRIENWTAATTTQAQKDRILYEFLFLTLRMRLLSQDKGQFFFKSRLGEMVVADTWGALALGSHHYLGRERIDAALEKMTVDTTYKEFLYLLQVSQPIKDIQAEFDRWNAKPANERFYCYTTFSVMMQVALYFEANRPFDRDWYGTPTEFDTAKLDGAVYPTPPANAPGIAEAIERLSREAPAYKKEIKRYFRTLPRLDLPNA